MYDHSQMRILLDTCLHLNFPFPTPQPPFPSHTHTHLFLPKQPWPLTLPLVLAWTSQDIVKFQAVIPLYSPISNWKMLCRAVASPLDHMARGLLMTAFRRARIGTHLMRLLGFHQLVLCLCAPSYMGGMNFVTQPNNALFLHVFHLPLPRVFSLL